MTVDRRKLCCHRGKAVFPEDPTYGRPTAVPGVVQLGEQKGVGGGRGESHSWPCPALLFNAKAWKWSLASCQRGTASSGSPGGGCGKGLPQEASRTKEGSVQPPPEGQAGAPGPSSVSASQGHFLLLPEARLDLIRTILMPGVLNLNLCASSPQIHTVAQKLQGTPQKVHPNAGGRT